MSQGVVAPNCLPKTAWPPTFYFGLISFALALGLMALATEDWHIVLAGALTGLGYGTIMPAAQAIAVDSVPSTQVGSGISTLFLFTDIGIGLGPILLGGLVAATGYNVMYAALAAVIVVAGVFYLGAKSGRSHVVL